MRAAQGWERVIGGTVPPVLRPLMATVGLAVTGQYVVLAFFAIYAVRELPVPTGRAGLAFAAATCVALAAGPAGGALSDRLGRRRVIAAGLALQTGACGALLLAGPRPVPAFAAFTAFSCALTLRWAAQQALVADLVGDGARDQAFAVMRTVFNVGASLGPLLGAGLVLVGWPAVWGGALALAGAALWGSRALPGGRPAEGGPGAARGTRAEGGPGAARGTRAEGGPGAARATRADGVAGATRADGGPGPAGATRAGAGRRRLVPRLPAPGLLLGCALAASVLAWTVYHGFEVLLPVSLTEVHGYAPAAWGVLFLVNPVAVVLLQVRLVRWTARVARRTRLAAAMALMGGSFLALPLGASVPLVLAGMLVFVLGEMLWGPTAQALVTGLAPPGARGTVMGVLASTTTAGGALASGAGLGILAAAGDTAMWLWVGAMAAGAAGLFWIAARPERRAGPVAPSGAPAPGAAPPAAPAPAGAGAGGGS